MAAEPTHNSTGARPRANARYGEQGFTLIEILVVITIIGLIMGLVGPRVLNYLSEAKSKAAKIQIASFASALDLYFLDAGRYPSTSEGLTALAQRPGNAQPWNGPYIKGAVVPLTLGAIPTSIACPASTVDMTSFLMALTEPKAEPVQQRT